MKKYVIAFIVLPFLVSSVFLSACHHGKHHTLGNDQKKTGDTTVSDVSDKHKNHKHRH